MEKPRQLVLFLLDANRFGLDRDVVERVVPVVEITPLPRAPEIVSGIINVHGEIVPVVDIRRRLGLPPRALVLQDQLLLAQTHRRRFALLVDRVTGVVEQEDGELMPGDRILPNLDPIAGVLCLPDGLVLIQDLETFLSLPQEDQLDRALQHFR